MKTLKCICIAIFSTFIMTSCSNSDDSNNNNNEPLVGNYFPLTVDDYWNYDVATVDNDDANNNTASADFLFVDSAAGSSYTLDVNTNGLANGSMNAILVNGTLNRLDSTLEIDGTLELPIDEFVDFNIMYTNVVLYDLNAASGSELSSVSDNIVQDFNGVPITIEYTLKTNSLGNSNSLTVNGTDYMNITKSNFVVNLSITTTIDIAGNPTTLSILNAQDVFTINNYFAEDVGLIKSEASITYQLDAATVALLELAGIVIPFPTSLDVDNNQDLSDFLVAIN